MEDKRVRKTKKNIKATLIGMLAEMPFEKVTIAELCRRGEISRITFYTHYDDKYALVVEMFGDYVRQAYDIYHRLQEDNNRELDSIKGYKNLLSCMLQMFYQNFDFFQHTSAQENPFLFTTLYEYVLEAVDDYLVRHTGIIPVYSSRQTAALLCNGLFGVVISCNREDLGEKEARRVVEGMYEILLTSGLFRKPG